MACLYDVLFRDSILFRRPAPACRPGRDLVQDGTRIDKGCDIVILDVVLNFIRSSGRTCRQARIFVSYHSLRTPREAITEIVRHAPPEVRPAIIALIRAAYRSLKRGYQPDVRAVPLRSWRSLLQLLSCVSNCQRQLLFQQFFRWHFRQILPYMYTSMI